MDHILINPLNLEYRFQHYEQGMGVKNPPHREAADPTLLLFKNKYYLFCSMSGRFWYSDDLFDWSFKEDHTDMYAYAPDVREINGKVYFCASHGYEASSIYVSDDPLKDGFQKVSSPFPFWDPDLFEDDDKKVYLYWGCSNKIPIKGQELDPKTMMPLGEAKDLFLNRMEKSGWEQTKLYKERKIIKDPEEKMIQAQMKKYLSDDPYIEGAFMTKHDGKYYLQYACPGTQYYAYGDGVYVADKPLGPFKVQASNPFSTKPGGFITAAGHGSTIQDKYGNYWHVASMRISVNANFERRIGLFPAGFDKDGVLFCNQNFADYPLRIPEGSFDPWSIKPEWMLLSYKKKVRVSSSQKGHQPKKAVDENIRTWWAAASSKEGEWLKLDLGANYNVHFIQINFADEGVNKVVITDDSKMLVSPYQKRYIDTESILHTRYLLEGSLDGKKWIILADRSKAETNLCHDGFLFKSPARIRYLRVTGIEFPYHSIMAISGLRVFGEGKGRLPHQAKAKGSRLFTRRAVITWNHVKDAIGANVRYGIAPDKLYSSFQVYGKDSVILDFLDAEQLIYYFAVDTFNEKGITTGKTQSIVWSAPKDLLKRSQQAISRDWSLYYVLNND